MAFSIDVLAVTNNRFSAAQTDSSGSVSVTSGRTLVVCSLATRDFHTAGLNANFGVSGGGLTWTERAASSLWTGDGNNFASQAKIWTAPVTSTGNITITVDGNTGGTQGYYYGSIYLEISADGEISFVQGDSGGGSASSPSIGFGAAPDPGLILAWWAQVCDSSAGTITHAAAPTNFAKTTGGDSSLDGSAHQMLESTTHTSTGITYAGGSLDGGGDEYGRHCVAIELAEASSGVSGSGAATAPAATTDATGTVTVAGAGATTAPPAVAASTAASTVSAAGSATAPAGTITAAGGPVATGTSTSTAPPATTSATGGPTVSATGGPAAPPATASGTATTTATAAGASTAPAGTAAGTGSVTVTATGASTAPAGTAAGAGTAVGDEPTGAAQTTAPPAVVVAAGTTTITGTGAAQAPPATTSSTASGTVTGAGAATAPAGAAAGAGTAGEAAVAVALAATTRPSAGLAAATTGAAGLTATTTREVTLTP